MPLRTFLRAEEERGVMSIWHRKCELDVVRLQEGKNVQHVSVQSHTPQFCRSHFLVILILITSIIMPESDSVLICVMKGLVMIISKK
jgi:hypothetical protein